MQRIRDKGKEKLTDKDHLIFLQKKLLESFNIMRDLFAELQLMTAYSSTEFRKKSEPIFILVNGLYTVLAIIQQLGEKIKIVVERDATLNQHMYAFIISLMPYIKKGHGHTLLHTSNDLILQDFQRICQFVDEIMKYIEKNNLCKFLQCEITGAPFSSPLEHGMGRAKLAALIQTYDETTQPNEIAPPIQWLKAFLEITPDPEIDFTGFSDFVAKNYGEVHANQLGSGTYLKSQKKDAQLILAFATKQPSTFTGLSQAQSSHFAKLPDELIIQMLCYLKNPSDLVAFLLLNSELCALGKDNMVWRSLLRVGVAGGFFAKKEVASIYDEVVKEQQRLPKELGRLLRLYNMDRPEEILKLKLDPYKLRNYLIFYRDESNMTLLDHAILHAKKTENYAILHFFYRRLMARRCYTGGHVNNLIFHHVDEYQRNQLHWAVLCFLPREELKELISKDSHLPIASTDIFNCDNWYGNRKPDIYTLTDGDMTPQHYAAYAGNETATQLFLERGYDPNGWYDLTKERPRRSHYSTPLYHAALRNQAGSARLLLDPQYARTYGNNYEQADAKNKLLLDLLSVQIYKRQPNGTPGRSPNDKVWVDKRNMPLQLYKDTPLFAAIRCCKDTVLLELFIKYINENENAVFATVSQAESDINCFQWAAYLGNKKAMEALLQHTTVPWLTTKNSCGATVLMYAVAGGHIEVVQFLLSKHADLSITMTANDNILGASNNDTLLHMAARKGHTEIVRFLLAKIAEINSAADVVTINPYAKNADGKTWQDVATADVKDTFSIQAPAKKSWMPGWMTSLWKTEEPEMISPEPNNRNEGP